MDAVDWWMGARSGVVRVDGARPRSLGCFTCTYSQAYSSSNACTAMCYQLESDAATTAEGTTTRRADG